MMKSLLAERAKKWPQQWMEKGRREGQARQLLMLLEQKFGTVPRGRRQEVAAADADDLLEWTRRILSAESLEHVFNGHSRL